MKKLFEVANAKSGHSFGLIAAESENEALDLVSKDAGYENYKVACDATGTNELVAEEVDIEELVESWVDQFMEDDPDFRCMAQVQLSQIIANSNAPAFPTLPEEYIDEAHDIAWELFIEHWRGKIIDEFKEQGVNQEEIDANGEGIEQSILPDVLSGTPVSVAVRDWVDWKKQDLEEREEEDAE